MDKALKKALESDKISNEANVKTDVNLPNIFVYDDTGEYADKLVTCARANKRTKSCLVRILPLIGLETGDISVHKIIQRVVVSHRWMGDRFKQLLEAMPTDTLQLFNSVSIIIIDSDTRPSFYWTMTGAIYIDPAYLWLTNQEKSNVTKKSDYRSDYGNGLAITPVTRYVKDNRRAYWYYSLSGDKERGFDDIKFAFFRLIFHELAHANDFAPPNSLAELDGTSSIFAALKKISDKRISKLLYQSDPLQSAMLFGLGQILYQGATATTEQKQITPSEAGSSMAGDSASNMYSYSTKYEDLAMLFEVTLMKKYFDIDMDIAFTNSPDKTDAVCADYIIGWGSRNRLANTKVKQRAKLVVQHILSTIAWDGFFGDATDGVGTEKSLQTQVDWCSTLDSTKNSPHTLNQKYIPDTINNFLEFPGLE
jgi:hypothetical protein